MAVIAAVNLVDRLVLLEDGRELPITQLYASRTRVPLKATDELRTEHHVDSAEDAEVFAVEIPGADTALIVEIDALNIAKPTDIN